MGILYVNSPGGSPVQADLISTEILNLKSEFLIKIITVVEDLCASAAYYIAAVSDEIYVNKNSLVGSIGLLLMVLFKTQLTNLVLRED